MSSSDICVCVNVSNLYESPSTDSALVSQYVFRTSVSTLDECGIFTLIEGPDRYRGWIRTAHLCAPPDSPATHRISSPIAIVRAEPKPDSPIITRLTLGAALCVAPQPSGGYRRVELLPDGVGFVNESDSEPVPEFGRRSSERISDDAIAVAMSLIGTPYLWAGTTPFGIDCSALVQLGFGLAGMELLRDAEIQRTDRRMTRINGDLASEALQPGDLLFFGVNGEPPANHVAIVIGDGRFIHARGGYGVRIDPLTLEGYAQNFIEARRLSANSDPSIDGA